ncbi:MAG: hypothetical protein ACP5IZ_02810 [Thermoprotei archaeon]
MNKGKRKSFLAIVKEVKRLVSALELPQSVHDEMLCISKKVVKKDLLKSHTANSMVAASLYIVCRLMRYPITLEWKDSKKRK